MVKKKNARPSRQERAARIKQELRGNPALDIVHPARFVALCIAVTVVVIAIVLFPLGHAL